MLSLSSSSSKICKVEADTDSSFQAPRTANALPWASSPSLAASAPVPWSSTIMASACTAHWATKRPQLSHSLLAGPPLLS